MVFKFKIRRARKSDLEAIAKIFREEFARPPFREKWGAKGSLKKIKEYLKGWAVLVAEASGKIVGFVACTTKYWFAKKVGFIDELVVSNKFQKRGVGHALLKKAEIEMGEKGQKWSAFPQTRNLGPSGFTRTFISKALAGCWSRRKSGVNKGDFKLCLVFCKAKDNEICTSSKCISPLP